MKSLDISGLHGSWLRRYAAVLLALTTSVPGASTLSAQARPLIRATTITEATLGVPLTRIGGVAPGPNGVVALVPRPGPQMVLLRGNAKPLFFSRAGAGPGEVQYPAYMGWVGDTLWVGDDALKRISLFSVAGKLLRTIPVQIGDSPVYLRDGSTAVIPAEVAESWEKPAAMESIRRARNGKIGATILSVSMRRRAWTIKVGRSNFVGGQPFDDFPLWNSFGDGSGFVLVTRAMRSASDSYFVVERYNESGAMRFARRYSFVPIPLGRAEIDAAVAGAVTGIPAPDRAAVQARAGEALYRPISL
ncbi:MAG: hypothetical protein ABIZ70_10885, partial [Gemmatimonadales bacterium]